ncbi:UbiA family prenyltransferase, partial [Eikenella corrodens]|nr:UbiA family prenyltransferase [Eikenella corrodens]
WLLFAANACWTLAYDTIYAMADKEDDLKIGIQTSAITFGRRDAEAAMLCHALFVLLMAAAGCTIHARWPYWLALVYAVWHQFGQYRAIRSRNREACFKVFLSNNCIGWALWLGLLAHYSGG